MAREEDSGSGRNFKVGDEVALKSDKRKNRSLLKIEEIRNGTCVCSHDGGEHLLRLTPDLIEDFKTKTVISNPVLRELFDDGRPIDAERFRDLLICVDGIGICMKSLAEQMRAIQSILPEIQRAVTRADANVNSLRRDVQSASEKATNRDSVMNSAIADLSMAINQLTIILTPAPKAKWWKWW